jgi:hypothetical protein
MDSRLRGNDGASLIPCRRGQELNLNHHAGLLPASTDCHARKWRFETCPFLVVDRNKSGATGKRGGRRQRIGQRIPETKMGAGVATSPHCAERLRSPSPFGPEPLRVTALTGAVLDRSGVAALLRIEILRWSAALLGMSIADVNLAARSPSSSLPAPVRRFPYPWVPQSPHPRSASDVLWVLGSSVSLRARLPSTS